jgi:hypothetical protein
MTQPRSLVQPELTRQGKASVATHTQPRSTVYYTSQSSINIEVSTLKCNDTLLHASPVHSPSPVAMPNLLVVLLILLLLSSISDSAHANDAELRALLTIKKDWGNPAALRSWKKNSSASASSTHCKWAGVACSNGQVTALSFQNFNISRPIPASICRLKTLTVSRWSLSYWRMRSAHCPLVIRIFLLSSLII